MTHSLPAFNSLIAVTPKPVGWGRVHSGIHVHCHRDNLGVSQSLDTLWEGSWAPGWLRRQCWSPCGMGLCYITTSSSPVLAAVPTLTFTVRPGPCSWVRACVCVCARVRACMHSMYDTAARRLGSFASAALLPFLEGRSGYSSRPRDFVTLWYPGLA